MGEIEVLIRAFAMLEMSDQYKSPLRNFLNEFSKKAMNFSGETINLLTQLFNDFWSSCDELPKDAFRNEKNKCVISLFDVVFATVCEKIKNQGLRGRRITPESLVALKKDSDFSSASQGNTASANSVTKRLAQARKIIKLR